MPPTAPLISSSVSSSAPIDAGDEARADHDHHRVASTVPAAATPSAARSTPGAPVGRDDHEPKQRERGSSGSDDPEHANPVGDAEGLLAKSALPSFASSRSTPFGISSASWGATDWSANRTICDASARSNATLRLSRTNSSRLASSAARRKTSRNGFVSSDGVDDRLEQRAAQRPGRPTRARSA